jgi:hypothetical protein
MRALCVLLIVCGACVTKPAPKATTPPPPEPTVEPALGAQPAPGAPVGRPAPRPTPPPKPDFKGDPCSGGEKPH